MFKKSPKKSYLHKQSIKDFGEQWSHLTSNTGYYGSLDVLRDICGPLFNVNDFKNKSVIDIGSGTGRITNLLIEAGASHVFSLEPSDAYETLKINTSHIPSDFVTYLNIDGSNIPSNIKYDYALCIGVLHHIPDPKTTILRAIEGLKDGGCFIIWLYGKEGNETYLFFARIIRLITIKLSHNKLLILSKALRRPLKFYAKICLYIRLPMYDYMCNHISKLDDESLTITIYDQLNPCYSKYYKKTDALELLESAGLKNCKIWHRHNYSWTVIGEK